MQQKDTSQTIENYLEHTRRESKLSNTRRSPLSALFSNSLNPLAVILQFQMAISKKFNN